MKMLDRGIGCEMCQRLPVPSVDDLQWMRSGQPLYSLVAEAVANPPAETAPTQQTEINTEGLSAVDAMNTAMDSLEELFGLGGDAPAKPAPAPVSPEEAGLSPVIESDLINDKLLYKAENKIFMIFAHRNLEVMYCPFCGSNLTQKA